MSIIKNTQHQKGDKNWQDQIKLLSSGLEKASTEKTTKLLEEIDKVQKEATDLESAITKLRREEKVITNVFAYHRQAEKELQRLNTHAAVQEPRQKNFLGTGTGTKWQTNGWIQNATNHFTPGTGKLDNIYKVKIAGAEVETTEEQVLNTIARVVKALQKVDATDFEAKYNAKESDTTKQGQVHTLLGYLQAQAAEIIVGSDKDSQGQSKQRVYDFSYNYHKGKFDDNGVWQAAASDYSQPAFNYQNFFDLVNLVHNQPF